jgi:cytochrome c
MKALFSVILVSLSALAASPAAASVALAQQKNCMTCHTVARKVVGPSFKDIAAKYANQPDATAKLTQKVLKGGSGAWGAVFMPAMKDANPAVSEAEARTLVQWIMTLK